MSKKFIAQSLLAGMLLTSVLRSAVADDIPETLFRAGDRVLFQGDSITDMARGRTADPNHILGHGYVFLIAAKYGSSFPQNKVVFINRGISGNKLSDLSKRWKSDTVDQKPDVLSILIGVNDLNGNVSAEQFEQQYNELLQQTAKDLPNVHLILCEPFGLPVGKKTENWDAYHAELLKRQAIVAKLAEKYHAPLAHFQKALDDACKRAPADFWIWDGIHPTYSGHQILADEWVRTVREATWK